MFPIGVLSQPDPPSGMPSLLTGLRAWYKFEEASGDRVDAHGLAPNMISWGVPESGRRTGKQGYAIDHDGTSRKFVNRDATGANQLAFTSAFSITCWLLLDAYDGTQRWPFSRLSSGTGYEVSFVNHPASGMMWGMPGSTSAKLYTGVTSGVWQFWHFYWTGSVTGLSLNNGTPVTVANTNGPGGTYQHFLTGGYTSYASFDGGIDELAFWGRNLTAEELTWLYNAGAGRAYEDI